MGVRADHRGVVRAALAFLALPGLVAFVAPVLLARQALRDGPLSPIGLVPFATGVALLVWCTRDFLVVGKGTLAPWDPPRHLVTTGLYRVSRNPMYVAVVLVLLGWTVLTRSWGLLLYTAIVAAAFHIRVVWGEEPELRRVYQSAWTRYASGVPRWIFPSRKTAWLAAAAAVAAVPLAGLAYEAWADASAAREFSAPGQLVDVGGRRLHLLCIGEGSPTVIFESSGFGDSLSSARARDRLASRMTVCSYDRRGRGWSDPAPGVTTIGDLVTDLGVLQDRARLQWPFVIVASSIGGLTAELFARQYPERVAGLVLLDAATSDLIPRRLARAGTISAAACSAAALGQFGVFRLADPFGIGADSDEARRSAALTYGAKTWAGLCATARGIRETARQFEQAPPLASDLPLTVLSASSTTELMPGSLARLVDVAALKADLEQSHREMAKRSSRGSWAIVPDSTHLIGSSQPDAVADAVFDLIQQIGR